MESMMMVGMLQLFASHSWLSARELITREPVYSTGDLSARLSRRIQKPNAAFLELLLQVNFHWNWFEGLRHKAFEFVSLCAGSISILINMIYL